ncbi:MAG: D-glycero-beta-D-manno-heptose 1,7-bisphosphate 7-phosphatase [Victivallaceae bacterium]
MVGAAFLDRDGVINEEVHYLHEVHKAVLIPGVGAAIREIRRHGWKVIVVTNQAGIAKDLYTEADLHAVNARISELLAAENAAWDAIYFCPHHPEHTGTCNCRKPAPGMLQAAIRDFNIDPAKSFMVGDRLTDLEAGQAAGCAKTYLVRTGYGQKTIAKGTPDNLTIVDNLTAAVNDFFNNK